MIYDRGNYNLMRNKAAETDWESLRNPNTNTYASNITARLLALARDCIPNRNVKITEGEPDWITTLIKKQIRKRNRAIAKLNELTSRDIGKNLEN